MATDTFSTETQKKYKDTHLWKPWMAERRLRQIQNLSELDEYLEKNNDSTFISWDVETSSLDRNPTNVCGHCLSFSHDEAVYIPTAHVNFPDQNLDQEAVWERITHQITTKIVYVYNWTFEGKIVQLKGIEKSSDIKGLHDVMIIRWMYDPNEKRPGLKEASEQLLQISMLDIKEVPGVGVGRGKSINFSKTDPEDATLYAAADPLTTLILHDKLFPIVSADQQFPLEIEHALLDTLLYMEGNAVTIDRAFLLQAKKDLTHWIEKVTMRIFEVAGKQFKLDSPLEMSQVLRGLGIPLKKTGKKTGERENYTTNADELEEFVKDYPIVDDVLVYRSLMKERSTYVDALLNCTTEERPTATFKFKSVGAPTGRFSSGKADGDPLFAPVNVQAIPSASAYQKALCREIKSPVIELG